MVKQFAEVNFVKPFSFSTFIFYIFFSGVQQLLSDEARLMMFRLEANIEIN